MRIKISPGRIDVDCARRCPGLTLGNMPVERDIGDLGSGIPQGHVECAHRYAPLAVPARLLARHHHPPGAEWVDVRAGLIDKIGARSLQEPRCEALLDQALLTISANGRETE